MLLICPIRPGDNNEELRYAIRSWETHLHLGDGNGLELLTVGYKPTWLDPDCHIEGNRHASMPHAVFDNIRLASEQVARSVHHGEVVFMNDDFFCLDPVGAILPVKRNCSLAKQIEQFPGNPGLWWPRSLRLTAEWLDYQGFPHPDSYEVHRPLIADARNMFETLSKWDIGSNDTVPQWRTIYGVMNKVDAYPVRDAKLGLRVPGIGTPWVSTSDQSFRRYAADIKKRFQKPSRWER
jgi:hypothetical protein